VICSSYCSYYPYTRVRVNFRAQSKMNLSFATRVRVSLGPWLMLGIMLGIRLRLWWGQGWSYS
jgi:hypothetical protein